MLTPRVRVFGKLTVSQTVSKLPVSYANRMSIAAFILPPVSVLSQINPIHDFNPSSWIFVLILSSHLRLGLSNGSLSLTFPHQIPLRTSLLVCAYYMRHYSLIYLFDLYLVLRLRKTGCTLWGSVGGCRPIINFLNFSLLLYCHPFFFFCQSFIVYRLGEKLRVVPGDSDSVSL